MEATPTPHGVNDPNTSSATAAQGALASTALQSLTAAILAGLPGGQTLIGGTGVTDGLKLQGTSGNGTLTSPAVQCLVGNNGGTVAWTVLNNGNVGIGTTAPVSKVHVTGTTTTDVITTDIGLNLNPVVKPAPTHTPALAGLGAGNVDNGDHWYQVAFYTALGNTELRDTSSSTIKITIVDKTSNGQVLISGIPISTDYRVTGRKIYRSKAAGSYYYMYLLATIPNNTDTTYLDNISDVSLGTINRYFQDNTTAKNITLNGSAAAILSAVNTAFGLGAGASILAGTAQSSQNALFGIDAGRYLTSGTKVTAIGHSALKADTTGSANVAVGHQSSLSVTTGSNNVSLGENASVYNQTGSQNTCIGYYAGFGVPYNSYSYNTCVGARAGTAIITGERNIFLGHYAGNFETGSAKLIIDSQTRASEDTQRTEAIIYGVTSATAANQILSLGGGGKVGIGVLAPLSSLHLKAGTATANTAPLQFTSGTLETTARVGVVEFLTDDWYATITTGAARKKFVLDNGTNLTPGTMPITTTNGRLTDLTKTITAPGTTGDQTINKPSGRVNVAALGTTIRVTNSLVTANSIVNAWVVTADATANVTSCVPAAGYFDINTAAVTGETAFNFLVTN